MIINKLEDVKKIKIYFFGNETQKNSLIREFIIPFARKELKENYYINRDWNGGPNVEIMFSGEFTDIDKLQQHLNNYSLATYGEFHEDIIKENVGRYINANNTISEMELKKFEEIKLSNHLKVEFRTMDMDYYKETYNSLNHLLLHIKSKFMLQPLIEKTLYRFNKDEEKLIFVLKNFESILNLYEHGEKFASVMFYSHIAGMLAIAEDYGKKEIISNNYSNTYTKLKLDKLSDYYRDDELLNEYKKTWKDIYDNCGQLYDEDGFKEEDYLPLQKQGNKMKSNVSNINSEFHRELLKEENFDNLIESRDHIVLRSIANILYSILIPLNIKFIEKHFCCYAISRYIFEKYNTTWKDILLERSVNNAS